MEVAIEEAKLAGQRGDKPIGAVLVHNHKVIGKCQYLEYKKQQSPSCGELFGLGERAIPQKIWTGVYNLYYFGTLHNVYQYHSDGGH